MAVLSAPAPPTAAFTPVGALVMVMRPPVVAIALPRFLPTTSVVAL